MILLAESGGREIPQPSLLPLSVVEDLDVLGDFAFGLFARDEAPVMNQFVLQGSLSSASALTPSRT